MLPDIMMNYHHFGSLYADKGNNIMRELIVMQGFSGIGKSFVVDALKAKYNSMSVRFEVCSTDDFWYTESNSGDPEEYSFDMASLGEAHKWNQRRADKAMRGNVPVVIIDNTNTQQREANPYINMAKANSYNIRIISVTGDIEVAKAANALRPKGRQVPEAVIENQDRRLKRLYV